MCVCVYGVVVVCGWLLGWLIDLLVAFFFFFFLLFFVCVLLLLLLLFFAAGGGWGGACKYLPIVANNQHIDCGYYTAEEEQQQ